MKILAIIIVLIYCFRGTHGQSTIIQKNVTIDYRNASILDATAKIYKFNSTATALSFTFKLKKALTVNSKVSVRGFMWINGDYQLSLFELEQPIVRAMGMGTFDIESLCLEYTQPAIVWPIQTGITYRSQGWNPDSSKYPINFLGGKWKILVTGSYDNATKFIVTSWFIEIVNKT